MSQELRLVVPFNLVSSTNDTNFFTPTSTTCPIKLYNVYKQEVQ